MKSIAVCSSAVHFKEVVEIGDRLRKLGFKVLLPQTADIMRKKGDYQVSHYKTWWSNPGDYSKKADPFAVISARLLKRMQFWL